MSGRGPPTSSAYKSYDDYDPRGALPQPPSSRAYSSLNQHHQMSSGEGNIYQQHAQPGAQGLQMSGPGSYSQQQQHPSQQQQLQQQQEQQQQQQHHGAQVPQQQMLYHSQSQPQQAYDNPHSQEAPESRPTDHRDEGNLPNGGYPVIKQSPQAYLQQQVNPAFEDPSRMGGTPTASGTHTPVRPGFPHKRGPSADGSPPTNGSLYTAPPPPPPVLTSSAGGPFKPLRSMEGGQGQQGQQPQHLSKGPPQQHPHQDAARRHPDPYQEQGQQGQQGGRQQYDQYYRSPPSVPGHDYHPRASPPPQPAYQGQPQGQVRGAAPQHQAYDEYPAAARRDEPAYGGTQQHSNPYQFQRQGSAGRMEPSPTRRPDASPESRWSGGGGQPPTQTRMQHSPGSTMEYEGMPGNASQSAMEMPRRPEEMRYPEMAQSNHHLQRYGMNGMPQQHPHYPEDNRGYLPQQMRPAGPGQPNPYEHGGQYSRPEWPGHHPQQHMVAEYVEMDEGGERQQHPYREGYGNPQQHMMHPSHPQARMQQHPQMPRMDDPNNPSYHHRQQTPPRGLPAQIKMEAHSYPSSSDPMAADAALRMGCTCKKSKCLKLYCQCFAASVMCSGNCRCLVCMNTPEHEMARRDAIKSILGRNPAAFETKFKEMAGEGAEKKEAAAQHKLGCKCRKSACLKKYCECFHADVKCSANCRCVGCLNQPPSGFGPTSKRPVADNTVRSFAADVESAKNANILSKTGHLETGHLETGHLETEHMKEEKVKVDPDLNQEEQKVSYEGERQPAWMDDAAQNLADLKHAGPTEDEKPAVVEVKEESMQAPQQTTESSPAKEEEQQPSPVKEEPAPPAPPQQQPQEAEKPKKKEDPKAVNTLLMAAYAMTEMFTNKSPPPSPTQETKSTDTTKPDEPKHPETPEKPVNPTPMVQRTPKRKSDESVDMEEVNDANVNSPPQTDRVTKRSRISDSDKKAALEENVPVVEEDVPTSSTAPATTAHDQPATAEPPAPAPAPAPAQPTTFTAQVSPDDSSNPPPSSPTVKPEIKTAAPVATTEPTVSPKVEEAQKPEEPTTTEVNVATTMEVDVPCSPPLKRNIAHRLEGCVDHKSTPSKPEATPPKTDTKCDPTEKEPTTNTAATPPAEKPCAMTPVSATENKFHKMGIDTETTKTDMSQALQAEDKDVHCIPEDTKLVTTSQTVEA